MKQAIEELFRMYKVDPDEGLLDALVLFVKNEKKNSEHEIMIQAMDKINEVIGKRSVKGAR